MIRRLRLQLFRGLRRSSRGSVAIMVAVLAVPMIGAVALATDASIWLLEQHRLQIAADAAAYAAALQLQNMGMHPGAPGSYVTLVTNEAKAASGGALVGTMATPSVAVAADFSNVTVTLSSTADTYFVQVVNSAVVTLRATAMAGLLVGTCVLALSPDADDALDLNNAGSIAASGCGVFSNSSSSSAIHVDTGNINAKSVGAHGGINESSSNSNYVFPAPVLGAAAKQDFYAGQTPPAPGACDHTNFNATVYGSYNLLPGTYCGDTKIGGNASSDTLQPGRYIFTGDVSIQNANITQAPGAGVTFIMEGPTADAKAGAFDWHNNSAATLSAPAGGLLLWQACSSKSDTNGKVIFQDGGALTASGEIYAPCGDVTLQHGAHVNAASNSNFSLVASTITVTQGSILQPAATNSANSTSQVSLLQ